jgi:hypothetical protein
MPAITLSPSFFKNELRAYADWRTAFWRELFQNSVDAKASTVWIDFEEAESNNPPNTATNSSTLKEVTISFEDDGPGMDRPTLEQTYFVVGETTKSASNIGGFGRARILTCFAHKHFRIHTQNLLCHGSGTQYTIEQAPEPYEGCDITVTISPDLASMEAMERTLCAYLRTCQLETKVYLRGTRFKDWTHKNRLVGELPFGKIYLNKSKCSDGVLVRVNGVQMFTRHTASTWQIVLELNPEQSRQTLTSNRDGLAGDAANELDRFIGKIWVNPVSATRNHHQKTVKVFGNTIYQVLHGHEQQTQRSLDRLRSPNSSSPPSTNHDGNKSCEHNGTTDRLTTTDPNFYTRSLTPAAQNADTFHNDHPQPKDTLPATPCYVHVVDCSRPELIRAAKHFLPDEIGGIRTKLLQKWTHACGIAATELAKMERRTFSFRTGFLFSEDDLGRCTSAENIHTLLVNPLTADGLLRYKLSNKTDLATLQALAAHETVHMIQDYHDERYAAKLTVLIGQILARVQRVTL